MSNTQLEKTKTQVQTSDEPKLKGTFIAVMFVGGFIVLTWITVMALFSAR